MLWLYLGFGILFGIVINLLTYRIPNEIPLFRFSSKCPHCQAKKKWYIHLPIIGYLLNMGTYKCCKKEIAFEEFIIPMINGLLWVICYLVFKDTLDYLIISLLFSSIMVIVFFVDLRHFIIPDRAHIAIILLAIAAVVLGYITWWESLLGGFIWGLSFFLIAIIGEKFYKKEVMGGGDIKLIAACGLLLGWQLGLFGLMIGSSIGLIIEIVFILSKKREKGIYIAFGPYLAIGLLIAMLVGTNVIDWYINLF